MDILEALLLTCGGSLLLLLPGQSGGSPQHWAVLGQIKKKMQLLPATASHRVRALKIIIELELHVP